MQDCIFKCIIFFVKRRLKLLVQMLVCSVTEIRSPVSHIENSEGGFKFHFRSGQPFSDTDGFMLVSTIIDKFVDNYRKKLVVNIT